MCRAIGKPPQGAPPPSAHVRAWIPSCSRPARRLLDLGGSQRLGLEPGKALNQFPTGSGRPRTGSRRTPPWRSRRRRRATSGPAPTRAWRASTACASPSFDIDEHPGPAGPRHHRARRSDRSGTLWIRHEPGLAACMRGDFFPMPLPASITAARRAPGCSRPGTGACGSPPAAADWCGCPAATASRSGGRRTGSPTAGCWRSPRSRRSPLGGLAPWACSASMARRSAPAPPSRRRHSAAVGADRGRSRRPLGRETRAAPCTAPRRRDAARHRREPAGRLHLRAAARTGAARSGSPSRGQGLVRLVNGERSSMGPTNGLERGSIFSCWRTPRATSGWAWAPTGCTASRRLRSPRTAPPRGWGTTW